MIPHVEKRNDLDDIDSNYDFERTKNIKWYHYLLLNRPLKIVIAFILVAVVTPILLYEFVLFAGLSLPPPDGFSVGSCFLPRESRLPCGIGNMTPELCHPQCCYDLSSMMCFHRFPSRFSYIMDRMWTEQVFMQPRVSTVPFSSQNSLTNIRLSIDEVSPSHLTLNFYNSAELSMTGRRIENKNYTYEIVSPELNVIVNSSEGNIFNMLRGPLIASDDIWEIAFKLTKESMYGLGEIPLREIVKVIYSHKGGLSSVPLIFAKNNGSYHGLLIDTVSPIEVTVRPDNVVMVRSITRYGLKFHLFVGPKPIDVMRDVTDVIGLNKQLQYWMLGVHVCSERVSPINTEAHTELNNFIRDASEQNLPFESHCGVTPIVFDNVLNQEQVDHVNRAALLLRNSDKRFIPHVSPYILYEHNETTIDKNETNATTYDNSTEDIEKDFKDYMICNSNSDDMYFGLVDDHQVIYPNYENVSEEFMEKLWSYNYDIDGVILENNWPLDESEKIVNKTYLYLPYFSENFQNAFNHTPQWNATRASGERYLYRHNQYGSHFAAAFKKINDTIPTWATSQSMDGDIIVNRQNINTSWTNLHKELIEAALGGISGNWLWSTPICGDTEDFNVDTHGSLCVKWYMAATYMPMIKIHSKVTPRHPLYFNGTDRNNTITALRNRLTLSPYFYTTLQGGPLLRPMFYQFPEVKALKDLTSQFSVGDDLLIVPNLQPSQSLVHVWMPPGSWYELWSGLKIVGEVDQAITMTTTDADFLTLVRGGSIVVMQKDVQLTADRTRLQSDFLLTIAMNCVTLIGELENSNTTRCTASGRLFMTSNMSIILEADDDELRITAEGDIDELCEARQSKWAHYIDKINIYGLDDEQNNYDNHKHITTLIDLCVLKSKNEIVFSFTA